tara:strand:- start:120 stop:653 length:534 start_codon:yes stop_codon:yes gene_type:complete
MAFKLNGKPLPVDVAFTVNGINYPSNWLRLTTIEEKAAIGITEVADDPSYDSRFYTQDGTEKSLTDINNVDENGDPMLDDNGNQTVTLGVKSELKQLEKSMARGLLNVHDWQIVRKAEKGIEIDSAVSAYRDGVRAAYTARKTEIDNCANIAALVALFSFKEDGTANMTQYPTAPNI